MAFSGAIRSIIRPLCTNQLLSRHVFVPPPAISSNRFQPTALLNPFYSCTQVNGFTALAGVDFSYITDTRLPKRRPLLKSKKRKSLRPTGPYVWVQTVPGETVPSSRPNKGSRKGRNELKRFKQRKAFIRSEVRKRKNYYAEFLKKRDVERIEKKMAAVARDKAWAERLVELKRLDAEKKAARA